MLSASDIKATGKLTSKRVGFTLFIYEEGVPGLGPVPSRGEAARQWRLAGAGSARPPGSPWWGDHTPTLPPTGEQAGGIGFEEI